MLHSLSSLQRADFESSLVQIYYVLYLELYVVVNSMMCKEVAYNLYLVPIQNPITPLLLESQESYRVFPIDVAT